jgi:nicotinamidase-related amidase
MQDQIPTLAPENAALVLIDHQTGTMQLIKNIPLNVVKRNALALAKVAKILNMRIVLTSSQCRNTPDNQVADDVSAAHESFARRLCRRRCNVRRPAVS